MLIYYYHYYYYTYYTEGSFPAGTLGNSVPKVILTVGTAKVCTI